MKIDEVDVLVIGAGPSGTVAAAIAQKEGLNVRIVEKSKFPRFVIGESLLPKSMDHYEEAGLLEALNTHGFQKKLGALFIKDDTICRFDFSKQYNNGWTWTWQVPRADFDQALANEVERKGVPITYECGVTNIEFEGTNSRTIVQDKEGKSSQINAKFVIDSSGWGRVIPRMFDLDEPSDFPSRDAIFTHCRDLNRPEGVTGTQLTFVVLEQDVWLWVIPFSNGITSLGVVGNPNYIKKFSGSNEERFRNMVREDPNFRDRFEGMEYLFEPKEIRGFSQGVKQLYGEGFALTGNSAEFLDPVFSSGVCFATESGLVAAKLAAKQIRGEHVDWQTEYADHIMAGVNVFRSYVKSWYDGTLQDVFFTPNENKKIKSQICSVLAGYVWDQSNPFVKKHGHAIQVLSRVVRMELGLEPRY